MTVSQQPFSQQVYWCIVVPTSIYPHGLMDLISILVV